MKAPTCFIGYRRSDTADAAGRIFDRLEIAFGSENVFKDVDTMPPGVDFRAHVTGVIKKSRVFLLLIGPRWLETAASGQSRIWLSDDFVRVEIEQALASAGTIVVPTLVSGAVMPDPSLLPPSIRDVVFLHAAVVRQDPDFRKDMDRLVKFLREKIEAAPAIAAPTAVEKKAKKRNSSPKVVIFGVGGAGGNAINNMIESSLDGVDFFAVNTDAQALTRSRSPNRIAIGEKLLEGLGASARPETGALAAKESLAKLSAAIEPHDLVFLTAGLGGGTGSGASPVLAELARRKGKTVVGVVSTPFHFEGQRRMSLARQALGVLEPMLDALVVVPNQNLFKVATDRTTFAEAFKLADSALYAVVRSVIDLGVRPGLVSVEFDRLSEFLRGFGRANVGTAQRTDSADIEALVDEAIGFPLSDSPSIAETTRIVLSIRGGRSLALFDIDSVQAAVRRRFSPKAELLFGSTYDPNLEKGLSVTVWANGAEPRSEDASVGDVELANRSR